VLQIRENGVVKLHTNVEIFASNPILKTHFYELGKNVVCKFFLYFMGPYMLYEMAQVLTS